METCTITIHNGSNYVIANFSKYEITIISPNGGENWKAGTTQTISWSYTGNPGWYVKIELLKGGVLNRTISSFARIGSGGSGSYNWAIPSNQTLGNDYTIRLTSRSNSSYTDTSDNNFTITGPPPPTISVNSPNGGEDWKAGTITPSGRQRDSDHVIPPSQEVLTIPRHLRTSS